MRYDGANRLGFGLGILLFSRAVTAQPHLELEWRAPAPCPQRREVLDQVREIANRAYPGSGQFRAKGKVARVGDNYLLELELTEGRRTQIRRIDAKACPELAGAAAVILALKLQQNAVSQGQPGDASAAPTAAVAGDGNTPREVNPSEVPSGAPSVAPASTSGAPSVAPVSPSAAPSAVPASASAEKNAAAEPLAREQKAEPAAPAIAPPSAVPETHEAGEIRSPGEHPDASTGDLGVWLGVPQVTAAIGGLPGASWMLGATLGARRGAWMVMLSANYGLPKTVAAEGVPHVGTRIRRYSADIGFAHGWRVGDIELAPGLSAGALQLEARGVGEDITPADARTLLIQIGVHTTLRWFVVGGFSVAATASAHGYTSRPRILMESFGEVRQLGLGQLAIAVRSEWNF